MAIRELKIDIKSVMHGNGFEKAEHDVTKLKHSSKSSAMSLGGLSGMFPEIAAATAVAVAGYKVFTEAIKANNYQIEQETKLSAVMNAQGFKEGQISQIKDYASALQEIGVVGDEATLAGTQQLATYSLQESSLKTLMPSMLDLTVQQKGMNATGQDTANMANLIGKAMNGQVGALSKAGISFSEAQEKIMKFGNETERANTMAQVITQNVGHMNEAMANTKEGRVKNVENAWGDMYETMGKSFQEIRDTFYEIVGEHLPAIISGVTLVANTISSIVVAILEVGNAIWDNVVEPLYNFANWLYGSTHGTELSFFEVMMLKMQLASIDVQLLVLDIIDVFQWDSKKSFITNITDDMKAFIKYIKDAISYVGELTGVVKVYDKIKDALTVDSDTAHNIGKVATHHYAGGYGAISTEARQTVNTTNHITVNVDGGNPDDIVDALKTHVKTELDNAPKTGGM